MAITNHERVGKALDLLRAGLGPFAEREFMGATRTSRRSRRSRTLARPDLAGKPISQWDAAALLKFMGDTWTAFSQGSWTRRAKLGERAA